MLRADTVRCFQRRLPALAPAWLGTLLAVVLAVLLGGGCVAIPEKFHQPLYHNPFPQLYSVAVLPFFNQSAEPTVDGEAVAMAYYNELQAIPGFEVMPVGVMKRKLEALQFEPRSASDFQKLARLLHVDAVLVGSITEFTPYYPPRMGLAVDWYAANPSFHPIPAGYGLPWGSAEEEFIPSAIVREAEFALAREQLKTQTPDSIPPAADAPPDAAHAAHLAPNELRLGAAQSGAGPSGVSASKSPPTAPAISGGDDGPSAPPIGVGVGVIASNEAANMPEKWPDPRGFIPPAPCATKPAPRPQYDPIISHTRIFHGHDADFTQRLESYFNFRDDARFGGWQGYLQRPDDFIRFCCHLHLTETLAARGGAGESKVVWRWPLGRYDR